MTDSQRIHTLGTPFDFDKITLTTPTVVQGGIAHFTKLLHGDEALYVQTPTCETRQGMVINGRKAYYDIILNPNAESSQTAAENAAFLEWVECLEDRIIRSLHEHGKVWFRDPLSEDDIRNLFTSTVKPFKGGKQFSIRINVLPGKARTNQFNCTVFDESENSVQVEYINATHNIISIVEVLGIRFTSNSFQLELASKQIAVILLKPVFQTCIIKKNIGFSAITASATATANNAKQSLIPNPDKHVTANAADTTNQMMPAPDIRSVDDILVDNNASSIKIKDPLEVYYALYKAARQRAREAKQLSIAAYLDAKNIKNTYNLQLVDGDSDDDSNDDGSDGTTDTDGSDGSSDSDAERAERNHGDNDNKNDFDSDSGSNIDDDEADYDDGNGNELKKRPPINISGDSIDLSVSDYDALG